MELIKCEELMELFFGIIVYYIKSEKEIPNINFNFNESNKEDSFIYRVYKDSINYLVEHSNDNCLSIDIHDSDLFFNYLTSIINETINLSNEYEEKELIMCTIIYILRRIWLRVGITDIENIEQFLNKQLQFVTNRTLDTRTEKKVSSFLDCDVYMKTRKNDYWDETTRSAVFTLETGNERYTLPRVLYDIDDEGICYIYGVQNTREEKSKTVERKLYKLNKGINNPNIHPSKVCALILFINQLKEKGITKVIVPSIQVLSYHYHELLSIQSKKDYELIKSEYEKYPRSYIKKSDYEYCKDWYERVYQKQDVISYLKTEELINLMYRLTEHVSNLEITNDVFIQGDSLILKLR